MLYLYLASNANGFTLALSPAAIRQAVGMPQSTYRDQFAKLVDRGYLVRRKDSNIYDFHETPERDTHSKKNDTVDAYDLTAAVQEQAQVVQNETPENIEININKINKNSREKQVSHDQFVF